MNATRSERLCDGVALGFAIWTVCCHALVASGGNLRQLIGLYAAALALAGAAWILKHRARSNVDSTNPEPHDRWLSILRVGSFAIGYPNGESDDGSGLPLPLGEGWGEGILFSAAYVINDQATVGLTGVNGALTLILSLRERKIVFVGRGGSV